jgi:hypothetical protein
VLKILLNIQQIFVENASILGVEKKFNNPPSVEFVGGKWRPMESSSTNLRLIDSFPLILVRKREGLSLCWNFYLMNLIDLPSASPFLDPRLPLLTP